MRTAFFLFLCSPLLLGAPLDPPQITIVPSYLYPSGLLFTGPGYQGSGWNGNASVSPSSLFPGLAVPADGTLILNLYARRDDTDGWGTAIASATATSWGPSTALRWQTSTGVDRMPALGGRTLTDVFAALGYSGAPVAASTVNLSGRMDWLNFFTLAADDGPASASGSPDPVLDYVILERRWQAYNTTSWTLTGSVTSLPLNGSDTAVSLRAGTTAGPSVWSNASGLLSGPVGSNVRTTAGQERYTLRLAPYPGNPSGLMLADFRINHWPQPQGDLTMPPESFQAGVYMVDGGTNWSLGVLVQNIFPGARVYAEIEGLTPTVYPATQISGFAFGPTLAGSFPSLGSGSISQASLIPAVPAPDGTYRLNIWHEYGGTRELIDTVDYTVRLSLTVRSNITELPK
jgi:hypothetical protein